MLKFFLLIILILINTISLADDCAEIARRTGGICVVPPIADQTDPDWEKMYAGVVLRALISSIQPSIITVNPNQLPQGGTANFVLMSSKTHFNDNSQIDIGGGITIDITKVKSDTEMLLNITAPANTTSGYYDITVNTGEETVTGVEVLRIIPASNSPEILSISPAILAKNSTIEMQIYGNNQTNFTESSIVKFATKQADKSFIDDSGITAQIKTVTSNLLTITANVTATASTGLHNITVITGTEKAIDNNELGSLRINERDSDFAEITSITPNNASQGDTLTINIAGSNVEFINNQSTVKFDDTGIEILSTTVISPTQATAEIKIADNALLGTRGVYITTGAEIAKKLASFAIFSPASISLNTDQGQQGDNVQLMITGDRTNFEQNVTQINFGENGITASTVTVINQTTVVANIQIANDAEPTIRDISVVTGEEVVALLNAFTVNALPETDESNLPTSTPETDEPNSTPVSISESQDSKVTQSIIEFIEKDRQITEANEVIIIAKRIDSTDGEVTVNYTIIDKTANSEEDFTTTGNTLVWKDGDNKDKEIIISILDDENVEEDEFFILKLTDVTGNAALGLSEVEITILNDDEKIIIEQPTDLNADEHDNPETDNYKNTLDSTTDIHNEPITDEIDSIPEETKIINPGTIKLIAQDLMVEEDSGNIIFTAERINGIDGELTAEYIIYGNTEAKTDFEITKGILVWQDGENDSKKITIPVIDDNEQEEDETFYFELATDSNYLNTSNIEITILKNDLKVTNFIPVISSLPTKICPESNEIRYIHCTFQNREVGDIFIAENASVSNAILIGNAKNEGLVSNLTIEADATLTGGKVTGYIQNEGTMADFTFVGASLSGGILKGEIYNNSDIYNVNLAPNTIINGGQLHGDIIGDSEQKAILKNLIIRKGSVLYNVKIVIDSVIIDEDRVFIDENVEFIH